MVKSSMVKKSLAWWLVVPAVLLALIPQQVHACSCVVPGPPADALAKASAVFAGKIIAWQFPASSGSSMNSMQITFDVEQVWKGRSFQTLTVYTVISGSTCSYSFLADREYLVYAYGGESRLQVSLCSRTKPLANAAEDLSALGEGEIPTEAAQSQYEYHLPLIFDQE
jgi:hypothetical protein